MSAKLTGAKPRAFVLANFVQACCWRVDRLPHLGETLNANALTIEAGGKGLNVALGLHRLGIEALPLLGCGQDSSGDTLLAFLSHEGISTQWVHRFAGRSGWGAGFVTPTGDNAIAVYAGANLLLTGAHAHAAMSAIMSSQLVYGQFEVSVDAVVEAFRIAHQHKIPTVLNPSPWQTPPLALQQSTLTLLVNEIEVRYLLGIDLGSTDVPNMQSFEAWHRYITSHLSAFWQTWPSVERLIVTLGELGVMAYTRHDCPNGAPLCLSAPKVVAVDSVGAGDAFASGYCAAILQGKTLGEALMWGNLCGSYMASCRGVIDHLLKAERLSALLAATGL